MKVENLTVAFIAAHYDDLEINAGGTIKKLSMAGNKLKIVTVSSSEKGGDTEIRKKEFEESLGYLIQESDEVIHLNYPDTELFKNIDKIIFDLERYLVGVDIIITHHPFDSHQDHVAVSQSVIAAGRNCPSILFFNPTWPSGRPVVPFSVDVISFFNKDVCDCKIKALSCHKSQIKKYGEDVYLDAVRAVTKADALRHSGKIHLYAELFEVNRIVI